MQDTWQTFWHGARAILRPKNFLFTLIWLLGIVLLVRLGIWQLDRLSQRRAHNAFVIQQMNTLPLNLNTDQLPDDLQSLSLRKAVAYGKYDYRAQIILLNQTWQNRPGGHLITPLVLDGTQTAVLVDRGWVPYEQAFPTMWSGLPDAIEVTGWIFPSQSLPDAASPDAPQDAWYRVDISGLQAQMPFQLLPVYIQQVAPEDLPAAPPFIQDPEIDLSEGPHQGYAIQWFIFSAMFAIGFLYFIGLREQSKNQ